MKEYKVLRTHYGDKNYKEGEIRVADPNNVRHLVDFKVLEEIEIKAEAKPVKSTTRKVKPE